MEFEQEYNPATEYDPARLVENLTYLEQEMLIVGKELARRVLPAGPSITGLNAEIVAAEILLVRHLLQKPPARSYQPVKNGDFENKKRKAFDIVTRRGEKEDEPYLYTSAQRVKAADLYTTLVKAQSLIYSSHL